MRYKYFFIATLFFFSCNNTQNQSGSISDSTITADTSTQRVFVGRTTVPAVEKVPLPVSENQLIIPGKSIGQTFINEKGDSVFKLLGKADAGDAAMGKSISTWYSKSSINNNDSVKHSTTVYFTTNMGGPDEANRAKQIRVTSPFFITSERLGVNSDFDSLMHYFPEIKKTAVYKDAAKKEVFIYDDIKAGIAFEINNGNKCVGVTIHPSGDKAFGTYLAFFDGIKFL